MTDAHSSVVSIYIMVDKHTNQFVQTYNNTMYIFVCVMCIKDYYQPSWLGWGVSTYSCAPQCDPSPPPTATTTLGLSHIFHPYKTLKKWYYLILKGMNKKDWTLGKYTVHIVWRLCWVSDPNCHYMVALWCIYVFLQNCLQVHVPGYPKISNFRYPAPEITENAQT